ncbi:hypothetical protein ATANTOWER_009204 [Ataeniobius toweri]|uniref:Uncharacterized protein n=1 Tax=Ataeniobius toweri TaxID=208326 RepID=A0ABU7C2W7_9TELE|nr:hypothetical protein [Ataeniobius toweri]
MLLCFASCYFMLLPLNNKNKILKITHICSKIICLPHPSLPVLNNTAITCIALLLSHNRHPPLHSYFTILPSGRRDRQLSFKTSPLGKIFVPSAITGLNNLSRC